jgi:hypothetical protein
VAATVGTVCPLGSLATQVDDCVLHHSLAAQSASTVHSVGGRGRRVAVQRLGAVADLVREHPVVLQLPPVVRFTVTVTIPAAPDDRSPRFHVTVPAANMPPPVAETNAAPAGRIGEDGAERHAGAGVRSSPCT